MVRNHSIANTPDEQIRQAHALRSVSPSVSFNMTSYLHEWSLSQVVDCLPPLNGEDEQEPEQLPSSTRKRVRHSSAPPDDVRTGKFVW